MPRPRLIILIRHAQSEGNKNRDIHQTIPDHRVKLTPDGWAQAYDAGRRLRSLLRDDDTLHFFTSPYRRTRETTEGILSTLTGDDPEPSPFQRSDIKVYEEPRLREQDFGNFQPCSAEMERMWQERADYGHFFYRIPNGESAADAYDRVSGFNESLWRQFSEDDFASVCVLVTHGLMSRVFLMKWYHFSVEYFEDLRNVNHCEFLIMNREDTGKYTLQNKLRTWTELREEKAAREAAEREKNKDGPAPATNSRDCQLSFPTPPRRWGGCPGGCDHGKHFKIRRDLAELRSVDEKHAAKSCITVSNGVTYINSTGSIATRRAPTRHAQSSDDDSDDPWGQRSAGPQIDVTRAREEVVSSPDGTPSFITIEDRMRNQLGSPRFLHVGRDFGGTRSGANSDTDASEDDAQRQRLASATARAKPTNGTANGTANGKTNGKAATNAANGASGGKDGKYVADSGMCRGAHANKLGDAPTGCCSDHASEDGGDEREDDDLARAEKENKSLRGSVY